MRTPPLPPPPWAGGDLLPDGGGGSRHPLRAVGGGIGAVGALLPAGALVADSIPWARRGGVPRID